MEISIKDLARITRSREFSPGTEPIRSPYYLASDVNDLLERLMEVEELDQGIKHLDDNRDASYGKSFEFPGKVFFIPNNLPSLVDIVHNVIVHLRETHGDEMADQIERALERARLKGDIE